MLEIGSDRTLIGHARWKFLPTGFVQQGCPSVQFPIKYISAQKVSLKNFCKKKNLYLILPGLKYAVPVIFGRFLLPRMLLEGMFLYVGLKQKKIETNPPGKSIRALAQAS